MGPLMLTVGTPLVLELWHVVQVMPLFPENPEIPPPYALAEDGRKIMATRTAMNKTAIDDRLNFNLVPPGPKVNLPAFPTE